MAPATCASLPRRRPMISSAEALRFEGEGLGLGEGFGAYRIGDDDTILKIVTSANVACGFHAGDPEIMASTFALAKRLGVAVGAHPGFSDLWGFGRRNIPHSA